MRHCVARDSALGKTFLLSALLASGFLATSISTLAQASGQANTTSTENQAPFQLKINSNLVVVRVVVRDTQNKPVENLKKEDFNLFDRGKKQSITQFAAETPGSRPSSPAPATTSEQPAIAASSASVMPRRFLALYFDDLNTSASDLIRARDAADHYLAANLHPGDRVGIFTSGTSLSDFTDDPKQIHEALFKLHANPLSLNLAKSQDCPDLSDYQAQQIIDYEFDENIDAWVIAIDQALNDPKCVRVPKGPHEPELYIANLARTVIEQALTQSRANLQKLDQVVKYVSQMPGQRTVLLVSPGFLSRSEQSQLDAVIDRALRSQVVISSLDPKGLANVTREGDASRNYLPAATLAVGKTQGLDSQREVEVQDVLAEVAQGTGGEFVHNNNDLQAGFAAFAPAPAYYLAFDPTDMKQDGKFHELKVELAEKHKGFSVQARRGYFAPGKNAEPGDLARQVGASESDAQAQEQIREAVQSKTDLQQLPVTMDVRVSSTKTEDRALALTAHLDPNSLHFRKDGQRNLDNVTFVFAIFDAKDNMIQLQKGQAKMDVSDAELQAILRAGLKMDSTFQLKPGIYRVREVVTDSEEHHVTAVSRTVDVSTECCVSPPELASNHPTSPGQPPPSPDLTSTRPSSPVQSAVPPVFINAPTYIDYPLRKLSTVVPALDGIKADSNQDQLPGILTKVGEATVRSLSTVPNLSSREDVYSVVLARDPGLTNSVLGMEETPALLDLETQLLQSRSIEFNYLLLFDHHADGATSIKELRTDFKNRQVNSPVNGVAPHGFGFAYQWLLLTPANQSELRFRYLGQQRMDDHKTFVLGFVQVPDLVKIPGKFSWAGKEAPFFFQGIVWIDQSTFDVVRLRTDLLSPVASVNLRQMTTELHFRSVRIHGYGGDLWLPSEVLIRTAQTDSIVEELHQYSAYRFFHAESRLVP
jgi:VWFA-related protein